MEIIVNDELDKLEIALNAIYDSSGKDAVKLWVVQVFLTKSRAAAIAVENTLRLRDMNMVPQSEKGVSVEWELIDDILEMMSENEHRRWNAFHFTQGIKCWDVPDDIELSFFKGAIPKPNQINTLNRHAALVEYKDLIKIDSVFNPLIDKYNSLSENNAIKRSNLQESDRRFCPRP